MTLTLYYSAASAPCRSVLLAAKALGLDLELKTLNVRAGENKTPEFLKLNPQHTIPTLVDDGFSVWESRAIITYLANKYGKGSSLYPEDPQTRALVDQRLYFDIGTLSARYVEYYYPKFFGKQVDEDRKTKLEDALQFLDTFLEGQTYVAGDSLTLADLSLVATVSTIELSDVDLSKYDNIKRWYETMQKTAPGYKEANQDGVDALKAILESMSKQ
nr:glutathione S-transferase delta 1 [Ectropis grisescens]